MRWRDEEEAIGAECDYSQCGLGIGIKGGGREVRRGKREESGRRRGEQESQLVTTGSQPLESHEPVEQVKKKICGTDTIGIDPNIH